ncbi:otubain [Trifolium medium]|uniref:Otubain n=1 Tax=Trifolium medium TaxID=97028 RepID=A0A392Q0K5_9FABA|nr:otubain [Trifolium medium]
MDNKKCGYVLRRTFGLPCACVIARKLRNNLPIRLDEVNSHWKKLVFDDREGGEEECDDYLCLAEWKAIQEQLKTVDVPMKAEIRDQLRQIAYLETTSLTERKLVEKKGAKKRGARVDSSTTRSPSIWEHVDARFSDSQA